MIVYVNDLIIDNIESIYPTFRDYKKKMVYTFVLRDNKRNCYEFERYKIKKIICDKLEFELVKNVVDLKKYNIDMRLDKMKCYIIYIRKFSIVTGKKDELFKWVVKTDNLYAWIGKYFCTSFEKVDSFSYIEISENKYFELLKDDTYFRG